MPASPHHGGGRTGRPGRNDPIGLARPAQGWSAMDRLTVLFRPHPRWLALLAILPFLAGGFTLDCQEPAEPAAIVATCAQASPQGEQPVVRSERRPAPAAGLPLADQIDGPQRHASDLLRTRGPPLG